MAVEVLKEPRVIVVIDRMEVDADKQYQGGRLVHRYEYAAGLRIDMYAVRADLQLRYPAERGYCTFEAVAENLADFRAQYPHLFRPEDHDA